MPAEIMWQSGNDPVDVSVFENLQLRPSTLKHKMLFKIFLD